MAKPKSKPKPFRIPARTLRSNAKAIEEIVKRMERERAPFTVDWPEIIAKIPKRQQRALPKGLKVGYAVVPSRAVCDSQVRRTPLLVLLALGLFINRRAVCFPSLTTLGSIVSFSPATICRAIATLERLGYVRRLEPRTKRRQPPQQQCSRYQVLSFGDDPLPKGESLLRSR